MSSKSPKLKSTEKMKRSASLHRSSSASSESPLHSPSQSSTSLNVSHHVEFAEPKPFMVKTDSTEDSMLGGFGGASGHVTFTTGDDDDFDGLGDESMDVKGLTKRDMHTLNEQRRRDSIKQGYAQLTELVPTCRPSPTGAKVSRAAMLQKTIEYIIYLQNQQAKQQDQLESLQREVKALQIMKENYEQIARSQSHAPSMNAAQVPDHVKFLVFQSIADQLFQSFNSTVSITNFDALSSCIISWLEEYCKPQSLREIVVGNLQRVNAIGSLNYPNAPPPNNPPN